MDWRKKFGRKSLTRSGAMTAEKMQIYKCWVCSMIVEVLEGGAGELVCCGRPMTLMKENTSDAPPEKHVPIIEEVDEGVKIKVGRFPHEMDAEHFISWVEIVTSNGTRHQFLEPGDAPEATFKVPKNSVEAARGYCTIHGLWET
jgi:superoxide reductase